MVDSQQMPDTLENPGRISLTAQKPGIGFPLGALRILLAGYRHDGRSGNRTVFRKETGETALLVKLLARLESGDILLADCYYCSHGDWPAERTGCGLCRAVASMSRDRFSLRGERRGTGDHIVTYLSATTDVDDDDLTHGCWSQSRCAKCMSTSNSPAFVPTQFVVVTTLTDAETYTAEEIGELLANGGYGVDECALEVHAGDGRAAPP